MRAVVSLFVVSCLVAPIAGCGSQGIDTAIASNAPSDPVARVVFEFLDAVRIGDTETSSSRLTPLALQRTKELELNFSPPGSPTARFQVGAVEMVDAEKAVVESVWTDNDADGTSRDEKITWALKLNAGQWRISGMAADMGPDQLPVVMDFENPGQLASRINGNPAPKAEPPLQAAQPSQDPFRTVPR